jgi:hypothetical protein
VPAREPASIGACILYALFVAAGSVLVSLVVFREAGPWLDPWVTKYTYPFAWLFSQDLLFALSLASGFLYRKFRDAPTAIGPTGFYLLNVLGVSVVALMLMSLFHRIAYGSASRQ